MMIDALQKLRAPAIALIMVDILNGMTGLLSVLDGLLRLSGIGDHLRRDTNDAGKEIHGRTSFSNPRTNSV